MAAKQVEIETCDFPTKLKINNSTRPKRILLFSGKRKSGKDYITDNLHQRIGSQRSIIIRLSGPIKTHWAKSLNLDINQLLGDGEYKEKYRLEMVKWGEDMRRKDYGYFCRAAIDMYDAWNKSVWIISDVRRKTDIKWFMETFGDLCKNIHIVCSEEVRQKRGWIFTPGIDDSETECDLDDVNNWDLLLENNNNSDTEAILQQLLGLVNDSETGCDLDDMNNWNLLLENNNNSDTEAILQQLLELVS